MRKLGPAIIACLIGAFCFATAIASSAQAFSTLVSFDGADGYEPLGSLVQGIDGNFYGTTVGGGTSAGTVFKLSPGGVLTTIYTFCALPSCTDGAFPNAGLVQGPNGSFYGTTTSQGNANSRGTIFEITPSGKLTTLYTFCAQSSCPDGFDVESALVLGANGFLYGTTTNGGASGHAGTVFRVTPSGNFTTLYNFCTNVGPLCTDGGLPSGLIQGTNGNFYGTTRAGTIFQITPAGKLTTLYRFSSADLSAPNGLIQANNGNFYGTTEYLGDAGAGTVFELSATGQFSTLYTFCTQSNCPDGFNPRAGLVQGSDGNFYGTTSAGGVGGGGTIFAITPAGELKTLHSFCSQSSKCPDGSTPETTLTQGTDGNFYGLASAGGRSSGGTLFRLSMGLGPFVETVPAAGRVGRDVVILGNSLTGTTNVSFNGVAATFTVVSETAIEATVPGGATTGTIEVTTPTGTLSSNSAFQVLP
jgi:uncharacterized repeat protein (TIGR03803 family)